MSHRGSGLEEMKKAGLIGPRGGIVHERKLQKYRMDKKNPKRAKISIEEDLGDRREITTLTAPKLIEETHTVPKETNGNWETIPIYGNVKIRHSLSEDRYYLFYRDSCLEEISQIEMYSIGIRFLKVVGAFRERVTKIVRGKKYVEYVLQSLANWKRKRGLY